MKKIFVLMLIAGCFFIFFGCEEQPAAADARASRSSEESYGEKLAGDWPPQLGEIEAEPGEDPLRKNFYVVFDGSGSMSGEKVGVAKQALVHFVNQVPENANLGLAVFDRNGASERAVLGTPKDEIVSEINRVRTGGGTPLASATAYAYKMLTLQGHRQMGYGEYNLVIVTDGEANSEDDLRRAVNEILKESPVVIHTIGFRIGSRHSLNQPGRILYKAADNLEELTAGLESVLAESEDFTVIEFEGE